LHEHDDTAAAVQGPSQFLSSAWRLVPKEPLKIARQFTAGLRRSVSSPEGTAEKVRDSIVETQTKRPHTHQRMRASD
jgi:hypothetical protein